MTTPLLDLRPSLTTAIERVVEELVASEPTFSGLDARCIVVVGLSAHGTAIASVRSLTGCAKSVRVQGTRRLVELGLRPRFFLEGDAATRIGVLAHELCHLDPARLGALRDEDRHARKSQRDLDERAGVIAAKYLRRCEPERVMCLAHHGEVLLRHWRIRPVPETRSRRFTSEDVTESPVVIHTPRDRRGGWW